MKELKITRIASTNKKKDGTILEGKYGTFFRVGIQTEEYGDQWLNGFSNTEPNYREGDTIKAIVETKEWNGKEQLNFKIAKEEDLQAQKIKDLEEQLANKNSESTEGIKKESTEEF